MNFRLQLPSDLTACAHAAMATEYVFHLGGHEPAYLRQAAAEAFALVDQLETRLSFYRESSDVTRINRAPAGREVSVSPDTLACLALAAEAARLTGGAFDAFTGRASVAAKNQEIPLYLADAPGPDESEVGLARSGRRLPGRSLAKAGPCLPFPSIPQAETPVATPERDAPGPVVSLHPEAGIVCKLRSGPWLDLGAIGKGFALDQAAVLLAEWDITNGCLIAGGSSLRGLGGPGWSLEIDQAKAPLSLPGEFGLGASGFQFQPGHIIDSRPTRVNTATARALVLAPGAALADALSTAAMLLKPEQLARLTHDRPEISSLVVDAIGQRHHHGAPFA